MDSSVAEKLLLCPCGREVVLEPRYVSRKGEMYWQPVCRNCGRTGAFASSEETATSLWNNDHSVARAFPTEADKKLLNEILTFLIETQTTLLTPTYSAAIASQFSVPLRDLIARLK